MVATQGDRGRAVTSTKGPCLGDATFLDHDEAVGERSRFDRVVGNDEASAGVAAEFLADHTA